MNPASALRIEADVEVADVVGVRVEGVERHREVGGGRSEVFDVFDLGVPAVELRDRVDLLHPKEPLLHECDRLALHLPAGEDGPVVGPIEGPGLLARGAGIDRSRLRDERLLTRLHLSTIALEHVSRGIHGGLSALRIAEQLHARVHRVGVTGGEGPGVVGASSERHQRRSAGHRRTSEIDAGSVNVDVHEERRHGVADLRGSDLKRVARRRFVAGDQQGVRGRTRRETDAAQDLEPVLLGPRRVTRELLGVVRDRERGALDLAGPLRCEPRLLWSDRGRGGGIVLGRQVVVDLLAELRPELLRQVRVQPRLVQLAAGGLSEHPQLKHHEMERVEDVPVLRVRRTCVARGLIRSVALRRLHPDLFDLRVDAVDVRLKAGLHLLADLAELFV